MPGDCNRRSCASRTTTINGTYSTGVTLTTSYTTTVGTGKVTTNSDDLNNKQLGTSHNNIKPRWRSGELVCRKSIAPQRLRYAI